MPRFAITATLSLLAAVATLAGGVPLPLPQGSATTTASPTASASAAPSSEDKDKVKDVWFWVSLSISMSVTVAFILAFPLHTSPAMADTMRRPPRPPPKNQLQLTAIEAAIDSKLASVCEPGVADPSVTVEVEHDGKSVISHASGSTAAPPYASDAPSYYSHEERALLECAPR
ncbi:hypothetical protein Q8F55_006166 [Vanrija albida]|uniref:Uncharacterized protein n=1 Tax=Vanrija albida TaxID=181172 RepID=A0ABR3PX85_9TREE